MTFQGNQKPHLNKTLHKVGIKDGNSKIKQTKLETQQIIQTIKSKETRQ